MFALMASFVIAGIGYANRFASGQSVMIASPTSTTLPSRMMILLRPIASMTCSSEFSAVKNHPFLKTIGWKYLRYIQIPEGDEGAFRCSSPFWLVLLWFI
jgi:hypothetical protein